MLPLLWLAFTAPPTALVQPPLPVLPPEVVQRLVDPPHCLIARCLFGEWRTDAMADIPAGRLRIDGDDLPGGGGRLSFSNQRRDWVKSQGSNARVGMQYGLHALQTADTSVRVSFDTGYRLQGYADDGIAGTGPIVRGQVEWEQALGKRAHLTQITKLEAGQQGAYLRNSLLLNVKLMPTLILSSGLETRRDSELTGRNKTDATLKLKYAF